MPELPEVETIRRALERLALGRRISRIQLLREDYLQAGGDRLSDVSGAKIVAVNRKGKYLALLLSNRLALLHHLGMSGRLLWVSTEVPCDSHTHVRIFLETEMEELRQRDPRRFGFFAVLSAQELERFSPWARLGMDALDVTPSYFFSSLKTHKRPIKSLLLEQHIVAGLGNIYADEALHRAGIHPTRPANEVSETESRILLRRIKQVLREAIRNGGTSSNDYRQLDGSLGDFQNRLRVYGREGKNCLRCGSVIVRLVLGGRSAHFCPACQR